MKHDMYIMAKMTGRSFAKYKGDAVRLSPAIPKTFDEVWIGVKKRPDKARRITTFRDKEGNVIEKCFDFGDGYLKNRVYHTQISKINKDETVKSTIIKEFKLKKRMLKAYFDILEDYKDFNVSKTVLWTPIKEISNHFASKKDGEKILTQVKISNMETPTKETHSFIEFPHIKNNKIKKGRKKILEYKVNSLRNKIIPNSEHTEGVKFPKEDHFLVFRAMGIDDAIEPITRFFLKNHGLEKAKINISPEYFPKNEDEKLYAAHFEPNEGSINFNINFRPLSKTNLVGTAAHETEHGWQYFLKALNGDAVGEWEEAMFAMFGKLCETKLVREARRYTKAIKNYVPLTKELKLSGKIDEYRKNYIEEKANKAGKKAKRKYDIEGKSIRKSFPHIPEKFI